MAIHWSGENNPRHTDGNRSASNLALSNGAATRPVCLKWLWCFNSCLQTWGWGEGRGTLSSKVTRLDTPKGGALCACLGNAVALLMRQGTRGLAGSEWFTTPLCRRIVLSFAVLGSTIVGTKTKLRSASILGTVYSLAHVFIFVLVSTQVFMCSVVLPYCF